MRFPGDLVDSHSTGGDGGQRGTDIPEKRVR